MKVVLAFAIDKERDYEPDVIEDEMAGAMSSIEEFEGANVTCKLVKPRSARTKCKSAAAIVRSWRDNINKERAGVRDAAMRVAPVLVVAGGKVLYWDELMNSIASAIEENEANA
jgi:hypothetical protein